MSSVFKATTSNARDIQYQLDCKVFMLSKKKKKIIFFWLEIKSPPKETYQCQLVWSAWKPARWWKKKKKKKKKEGKTITFDDQGIFSSFNWNLLISVKSSTCKMSRERLDCVSLFIEENPLAVLRINIRSFTRARTSNTGASKKYATLGFVNMGTSGSVMVSKLD